jgi:triacylglycerol lipase
MRKSDIRVLSLCVLAVLACAGGCGSPADSAATDTEHAPLDSYAATRYPIVLIPGFLGFKKLLGTVEYFSGVADALEQSGARIFQVDVSQAADSTTRAHEILPQLDAILQLTGSTKVNLIGHSQGGIDARVIAALRPQIVASITTIGSPHTGTLVAKNMLALPLGLGVAGVQGLADFFELLSGSSDPNDARACLTFLAPSAMAAFNATHPDGLPTSPCGAGPDAANGILLYSWGGVGWLTNALDPMDPMWAMLGVQIGGKSDGLVPQCGSHFGHVIRDDYPYNHIDETNMIFGLVSPMAPNPKTLYRNQANRLKNAGL